LQPTKTQLPATITQGTLARLDGRSDGGFDRSWRRALFHRDRLSPLAGLPFHNAICHSFVLVAASCHYAAILHGVVLVRSWASARRDIWKPGAADRNAGGYYYRAPPVVYGSSYGSSYYRSRYYHTAPVIYPSLSIGIW